MRSTQTSVYRLPIFIFSCKSHLPFVFDRFVSNGVVVGVLYCCCIVPGTYCCTRLLWQQYTITFVLVHRGLIRSHSFVVVWSRYLLVDSPKIISPNELLFCMRADRNGMCPSPSSRENKKKIAETLLGTQHGPDRTPEPASILDTQTRRGYVCTPKYIIIHIISLLRGWGTARGLSCVLYRVVRLTVSYEYRLC